MPTAARQIAHLVPDSQAKPYMNLGLQDISAFSLAIPILLSIFRFNMIGEAYRPFIYLLWIGGANEILSNLLINRGYYNAVNSNIYSLVESLLLLWFFRNSGAFNRAKFMYPLLFIFFTATWLVDVIVFGYLINGKFIDHFNTYFSIITGLPIVLSSINVMNDVLTRERDIARNPSFLICVGLMIYFTYRTFIEACWLFYNQVYDIHSFINLLCNLIYAIAVLWMQRRQAFTLRY
jgi:hypothetical protein